MSGHIPHTIELNRSTWISIDQVADNYDLPDDIIEQIVERLRQRSPDFLLQLGDKRFTTTADFMWAVISVAKKP